MKKCIKKHQVAFNMNDREQKEMYEYLESFTNVSAKIKRMTLLDMQKPDTQVISIFQEVENDDKISKIALDLIL